MDQCGAQSQGWPDRFLVRHYHLKRAFIKR
jgi:hypothetical protein